MHTNYAWLGFLAAAALVVLAYCFSTVREVTHYYTLITSTTAQVSEWSIGDQFLVKAAYRFEASGKNVEGSYLFKHHPSRNRWSAEKKIEEWQQREWTVWYSPNNPSVSQLERPFPTKSVVSALVLVAIYLYFVGLGYYVRRMAQPQ